MSTVIFNIMDTVIHEMMHAIHKSWGHPHDHPKILAAIEQKMCMSSETENQILSVFPYGFNLKNEERCSQDHHLYDIKIDGVYPLDELLFQIFPRELSRLAEQQNITKNLYPELLEKNLIKPFNSSEFPEIGSCNMTGASGRWEAAKLSATPPPLVTTPPPATKIMPLSAAPSLPIGTTPRQEDAVDNNILAAIAGGLGAVVVAVSVAGC